jgi:glucose/arabinose dehydrogenase
MRWTLALALVASCYTHRESKGGGETKTSSTRRIDTGDIALPDGYRIEAVATGLTFPTGVAFDAQNRPHVVEAGYSYGEVFSTPRLLRLDGNGASPVVVASVNENGPWTGVAFADGAFYVAEGGTMKGGRILRIEQDGKITELVRDLPTLGDHHTNGPAVGPDGSIYFALGTATNGAVVGEDNFDFGWLKRAPAFHDVPCRDVTLAGTSFESANPLTPDPADRVRTGAYVPFGTPTEKGQVIKGQVPCSGAVLRIPRAGGPPELVAWGFRNPFGLAFRDDGTLFVTDNGFDDRGSRPVYGAGDMLWRIEPGAWYGWPDFAEGRPVDQHRYVADNEQKPRHVLAENPGTPPSPVAIFAVHSSSDGLDFSRSTHFGHVGEAFVAQLGDQAPVVGKVLHPVGFKVVRVEIDTGVIHDFAVNRGTHNGPASELKRSGLERPVAVRFDNTGEALYVVDFGIMTMTDKGAEPRVGTGVLWRITR